MKQIAAIVLFLTGQLCFANMASPIRTGTYSASPFSSRDIDIRKETIHLKMDKEFNTAQFEITYFIKTDTAGKQIPLLFHARDYKGDFKVWVDNQPVALLDIPAEYTATAHSPFEKFSDSFEPSAGEGQPETVVIYWEKNSGIVYKLNDLKYFEADLSKGEHQIRVEYTANAWTDVSDWVREYSFRYSLSPAKNWKSFGTLEITTDASAVNAPLTTNLGQPASGNLNTTATWNFTKLPANYFEITCKPRVSRFAGLLITLSPLGLTLIFSLLMASLHLLLIANFRKTKPDTKHSWVVIAGSILIPFTVLVGYMYSFSIIDNAIGAQAGKYHGYTFLVMIFYPLLMPLYWGIMWGADRIIKHTIHKGK